MVTLKRRFLVHLGFLSRHIGQNPPAHRVDPEDELFELFLVLPRPVAVRETDAETAHHVAVERARRHVQHVLAFEIESFYHSERSVKVCSMEHRSEQLSTFVKLFNL